MLTVSDLSHPRFSRRTLTLQYDSLRDGPRDSTEVPLAGNEDQVGFVVRRSAARFAAVVRALRGEPGTECCSLGREMVTSTEANRIRPRIDPVQLKRAGTGTEQIVSDLRAWFDGSHERWTALVALFDDGRRHERTLSERAKAFRALFR